MTDAPATGGQTGAPTTAAPPTAAPTTAVTAAWLETGLAATPG